MPLPLGTSQSYVSTQPLISAALRHEGALSKACATRDGSTRCEEIDDFTLNLSLTNQLPSCSRRSLVSSCKVLIHSAPLVAPHPHSSLILACILLRSELHGLELLQGYPSSHVQICLHCRLATSQGSRLSRSVLMTCRCWAFRPCRCQDASSQCSQGPLQGQRL